MGGEAFRKCVVCSTRLTTKKKGGTLKYDVFMAKFPLDENRCKQWVQAVGNPDLVYVPIEKLHQLRYVCSAHFRKKYVNKKGNRLKKNAVPSENMQAPPLSDDQIKDFPFHAFVRREEMSGVTISNMVTGPQNLPSRSKVNNLTTNDSVAPIEASDKNIGAVPESPTSCSLEVDQDESDEEQSDEDGCNPAVSTWINKLETVDTAVAPSESSDNVNMEGSTSSVHSNEQRKHHESDELPTCPATEGSLEAEDQGSAEHMDDYTMDNLEETEIEYVDSEQTSARCCTCLCSGSQLTPLESIEIVVRPGLTRHLDTLYTDLTGLTVPECIGGAAICVKCVSRLTVAYMFKLQCMESHAVLTSSSTVLPPPAHHNQQSAPGSPEGWPPSQDESTIYEKQAFPLKKQACPTRPVATASPDVNEPSGTVSILSNTSHSSTETKDTSSVISISEYNKKRKKPEELNIGSNKRSFRTVKYEENDMILQKCQSCGKAAAVDAKIELAIQLTKQSLCCICTKAFRDSTALREHARTSHSTGFQDFLIIATNTSRMCTCNHNKKLLLKNL